MSFTITVQHDIAGALAVGDTERHRSLPVVNLLSGEEWQRAFSAKIVELENLNRELEARFGSADSPEPSQAEWLDAKLKKWSDELKSRLKTALALEPEDTPEEQASWGFMKLLTKLPFLPIKDVEGDYARAFSATDTMKLDASLQAKKTPVQGEDWVTPAGIEQTRKQDGGLEDLLALITKVDASSRSRDKPPELMTEDWINAKLTPFSDDLKGRLKAVVTGTSEKEDPEEERAPGWFSKWFSKTLIAPQTKPSPPAVQPTT